MWMYPNRIGPKHIALRVGWTDGRTDGASMRDGRCSENETIGGRNETLVKEPMVAPRTTVVGGL
jgi:hypothetical protein